MDTRQFLHRVLGGDGRYCTFAARKTDERIKQDFHTSIDEAIDRANELDEEGYDTFFALATFGPENKRTADNAIELRALFLDIDCGPGKPYATQMEGIEALQKFCKQLTLPKPQLVSSGRGVHVYWALTEAVSAERWQGIAERLKRACEAKKLEADPAVTADTARILRVPGTHHYKGEPKRVTLLGKEFPAPVDLDDFASKLAVFTPAPKVDALQNTALMDALAGNKESSFKKIIAKTKAGEGCAQLAYIIRHQDQVDEPYGGLACP